MSEVTDEQITATINSVLTEFCTVDQVSTLVGLVHATKDLREEHKGVEEWPEPFKSFFGTADAIGERAEKLMLGE